MHKAQFSSNEFWRKFCAGFFLMGIATKCCQRFSWSCLKFSIEVSKILFPPHF